MITLEQVEKLKERANVSYEDARSALEITDGDLLEAVIYLERQGKIRGPEMNSYNTQGGPKERRYHHHSSNRDERGCCSYQGPTIRQQMHYFWRKLCELIRKTNSNQFEISRDGRSLISMPVTLLIISIICFFWVTLPMLIIALFFGCRYRFTGPDFGKDSINNVMNQAADTAQNLKFSVMAEAERAQEAREATEDGDNIDLQL